MIPFAGVAWGFHGETRFRVNQRRDLKVDIKSFTVKTGILRFAFFPFPPQVVTKPSARQHRRITVHCRTTRAKYASPAPLPHAKETFVYSHAGFSILCTQFTIIAPYHAASVPSLYFPETVCAITQTYCALTQLQPLLSDGFVLTTLSCRCAINNLSISACFSFSISLQLDLFFSFVGPTYQTYRTQFGISAVDLWCFTCLISAWTGILHIC